MSDCAPWIGREQTIEALGRTWRLGRWTRSTWKELRDWALPLVPDPIEAVSRHLARMPKAAQEYAVKLALEAHQTFLAVGSPELQSILNSMEGSVRGMWLLLREHQPAATEDDAYALVMTLKDRVPGIFAVAMGSLDPNAESAPAAP